LRVEAYGGVDETNAFLGVARQHTTAIPSSTPCWSVSRTTFSTSARIWRPPSRTKSRLGAAAGRRKPGRTAGAEIDGMNGELSPLTSFVLPAGSPAAAALHVARTVCRRAERTVVQLSETEGEIVGQPALKYLNRLSDLLFVAARRANDKGAADVLWKPGATR
jgi:cob(I)alamin adenosyltransferase